MLNTPCYILSDAHIGFAPDEVERAVVSFLRHVATEAKALVVNGDLFEFWFEWKTVIPRRGFRALAALADVVDAGVPVLMIAGNHDCWGGEVLRRDVGVDYVFGPWRDDIGRWRATSNTATDCGRKKTSDIEPCATFFGIACDSLVSMDSP